MRDAEHWSAEFALLDRAIGLSERITERKYYFRRPHGARRQLSTEPGGSKVTVVDRDRALCALALKGVNTGRAISRLCREGFEEDARALCRVLIENAILISWIEHNDWPERTDAFVLSEAPNLTHLMRVAEDHIPSALDGIRLDPDTVAISEELFNDDHMNWAHVPDPDDASKTKKYGLKMMAAEIDSNGIPRQSRGL